MRKSASFECLFTLINVAWTEPRWTENRRRYFQLSHVVLVHQLNAHSHSFIKIFSEKVCRKLTCRTHSINLSSLPCAGKFTAVAFCTSIVPVGRSHRCLSMHSKCFVISVANRRVFHFMCHFHSRTPKLNWAREKWFSDAVYHACDIQLYPYHVVAPLSPMNAATCVYPIPHISLKFICFQAYVSLHFGSAKSLLICIRRSHNDRPAQRDEKTHIYYTERQPNWVQVHCPGPNAFVLGCVPCAATMSRRLTLHNREPRVQNRANTVLPFKSSINDGFSRGCGRRLRGTMYTQISQQTIGQSMAKWVYYKLSAFMKWVFVVVLFATNWRARYVLRSSSPKNINIREQ